MADIKEWDRGETARIWNTYTNTAGAAVDPDSITLKIYDPAGVLDTTVTYSGDIVKSATGIYYYDYDIAADAEIGWWVNKWTAAFGTQEDITKDQFYVRDPEEKLYCSVSQAYNRCGMESEVADTDETTDYIRNAMAWIDSYFGKSFGYSNSYTQWFDTDQANINTVIDTVFLRYRPVRSITSVEEYDTSNDLVTTHSSDDYWLDDKTGKITLATDEFEHQKHRVKVVYTYGFDQVPRKVTELCAILSGQSILLKFAGQSYDDVTSWSAAGLCFSGDMKLLTVDGYQTFESLEGRNVKLINKDDDISNGTVWCSGEKETVKVIMEDNEIRCTPDHRFMLYDHTECRAIDLIGKEVLSFDGNPVKVLSIEQYKIEKIYDFSEPLTNWGIVGGLNGKGIVVHNSIGVGEPYMNATRTFELLNKQKDKLLGDIGRLRESIFIV